MADRAEIEISATTNRLAAGLRQAKTMLSGFASTAARGVGHAFSAIKLGDIGKNALGHLGGNIATRGLDILVDGAKGVIDFERNLNRFQINAELSTAATADFRNEIAQVSSATGASRESILSAANAYVGFTGNATNARQSMALFAEVAQATGASMDDVAGIAATFDKNLNIDPSQWRASFDIIAKQAHLGGIEMKDMATRFATVGAMYSEFAGGASTEGLAKASALAQVLQNLTHDSAETSTALKDLFLDLGKNASKLRYFKIEPFTTDANGKKVMKDPLELLDAIHKSPLAKDPELMQKVFPEMKGRGALQYLLKELDAVHDIADASLNSNQIAKDYAVQQESSAGRIDKAMNSIRLAVAEAFTPERIQMFANALESAVALATKLIHTLEAVAKWVADQDTKEQAKKIAAQVPAAEREKLAKEMTSQGRAASARRGGLLSAVGGLIGLGGLSDTGAGRAASEKVLNVAGVSQGALRNDFITGKFHREVATQLAIDPWTAQRPGGGATADSGVGGAAMNEMLRVLGKIAANTSQDRPVSAKVDISRDSIVDANRNARRHGTRP